MASFIRTDLLIPKNSSLQLVIYTRGNFSKKQSEIQQATSEVRRVVVRWRARGEL